MWLILFFTYLSAALPDIAVGQLISVMGTSSMEGDSVHVQWNISEPHPPVEVYEVAAQYTGTCPDIQRSPAPVEVPGILNPREADILGLTPYSNYIIVVTAISLGERVTEGRTSLMTSPSMPGAPVVRVVGFSSSSISLAWNLRCSIANAPVSGFIILYGPTLTFLNGAFQMENFTSSTNTTILWGLRRNMSYIIEVFAVTVSGVVGARTRVMAATSLMNVSATSPSPMITEDDAISTIAMISDPTDSNNGMEQKSLILDISTIVAIVLAVMLVIGVVLIVVCLAVLIKACQKNRKCGETSIIQGGVSIHTKLMNLNELENNPMYGENVTPEGSCETVTDNPGAAQMPNIDQQEDSNSNGLTQMQQYSTLHSSQGGTPTPMQQYSTLHSSQGVTSPTQLQQYSTLHSSQGDTTPTQLQQYSTLHSSQRDTTPTQLQQYSILHPSQGDTAPTQLQQYSILHSSQGVTPSASGQSTQQSSFYSTINATDQYAQVRCDGTTESYNTLYHPKS